MRSCGIGGAGFLTRCFSWPASRSQGCEARACLTLLDTVGGGKFPGDGWCLLAAENNKNEKARAINRRAIPRLHGAARSHERTRKKRQSGSVNCQNEMNSRF